MGFISTCYIEKRVFTLYAVNHSGPPDMLTIRARSSDFNDTLKTKREQSWHQKTLGDILTTLAKRNGLDSAISDQLANIAIEHIDQTNESDLNLLTRLSKLHDAVATIKANRLLFTPRAPVRPPAAPKSQPPPSRAVKAINTTTAKQAATATIPAYRPTGTTPPPAQQKKRSPVPATA